jgi:ubiquitin carboxyl-terminal hydrolase 9/13
MGTWVVFDDDAVEPIKEGDIPKYFGDSNAGSAYVLYYQAVDLNPQVLGLQKIEAESKEQVQEVAPPLDSAGSPQQAAPALPPGLGEETESSDSDPLLPVTYAPPPKPLEPHVAGDDSTVKIVSNDKAVPPLPPTPLIQPIAKGGILRSLRRSPSTKAPPPLSIGPLTDPNGTHSRQPTLKTLVSQENIPAVPPLPTAIDGKDPKGKDEKGKDEKGEKSLSQQVKEHERKINGWFHLISPKSEKPRTSMEHPSHASLKAESEKSVPSSPSPSVWFRASGSKVPPKSSQRPSEPGLFEQGIFNAFGILAAPTGTSAERRQHDGIHGSGSHSAASVASSTSATPGVEFPSTSSSRSRLSYRSSLGPLQLRPDPLPSEEQDRVSEPRLVTPAKQPGLLGPASNLSGISIPPLDLNDVPALELSPVPPAVPPKSVLRAQMNGTPEVPEALAANGGEHEGSLETWQKLEKAPQTNAGIGAFPTNHRSSIVGSVSLRRASRKLSLSVPIPGFARRDKQKEQGKDKDKEREQRGRDKDKVSTGSVVGYSLTARG